ncbi:Protein SFI1-like protein [Camelus dromedarius]|uniref:Protein SFI1-like protein n=1 Tax=Camelus dromedarius TaxID=9838 RepID=A0A5N4CBE4_CAMDR|nr:Protein SFI1-like protein [Camelus dromedarius]
MSPDRSYYEQRLLRKVFEEWKEEWWVFHHEWKLRVRADCHYRTKLQMQTTALEFRQRSILWVWWREWRQRLGQVRVGRALHASAVKHSARSLQLQAWSRWQEQLLHVWRERQKVVSAVKHHQHWQQRRALKAWLEYLQVRRVKRQRNEMAERFHHVTVLQTHFCDWQWAWERRESLHAHHARVEGLARRMVLRRALTHWKHCILSPPSPAHHMCCCVQRTLPGERRQKSTDSTPCCSCTGSGTSGSLGLSRGRTGSSSPYCMLPQTTAGGTGPPGPLGPTVADAVVSSSHHSPFVHAISLLRKCIKLWLQHTQKRRTQQVLQARADGHFQQRALPAAFQAWRRLWRRHQQESALSARAVRFHRFARVRPLGESLEKQVFVLWRQKMFQHQEHRLAERLAILHLERQLLRRSWSTWHQQAAACRLELQQQAVACAHHRLGRLRKAFSVWRERARGLRTERMGRAQAAQFQSAQLLRGAWSRWKECLALRGAERQKLMRAGLHHRHTLLSRALQTWGIYQSHVRSILQEAAARESQHERRVLRDVLHRWRENAVAQADEAKKASRAAAHYRRTLCSKVLTEWQEVASVQIFHRQQEECAIREAQVVLSRGCLRTWFRRWRDRSQRAAQRRVRLERAAQHHHRQLLLQALARWKVHHLGCVRKRVRRAAAPGSPVLWAPDHSGTQIPVRTLSPAPAEAGHPTPGPDTQPGLLPPVETTGGSLEKPPPHLLCVWTAWLGFVLERRRKKARQERAVQVYHQRLLREGITRLLRFAAGTKAFRQQLHAQQQVQVSARPTPQASPSLAGVPKPHLLLPGDFTARPGGCDAAGVHLRPVGASSTRATPGTRDPWFHPGPNRQDGEDQACLSVATSHSSLEAELEGIQQQLQDYQTMKQNLRSCQRQASSLRRWLELSREESRPEDQEAEQQVHEELQEVELQIQQLASEIQARRQPIRACIARVQALRQALC